MFGIGRQHAVDVGADLADRRIQRRSHGRPGDVPAAAAERRHFVVRGDALEARNDDDLALAELLDDAGGVDRLNAGAVERSVRADVALRAGQRDRRHSFVLQCQRQGRHSDLLARRQQQVVVAAVRIFRYLPRERDELIGGLAHGGDRHDDVRMGFEIRLHPVGDGENLLGRSHRASTVLLHNDRT